MPARNGKWQGSKWIRPARRVAIYHRDGFHCVWCGAEKHLSLDHLWRPNAVGKYDNRSHALVTCCDHCNSSRSGRKLRHWLHALRERGLDLCAIVKRLRAAVRTPVDVKLHGALVYDKNIRRRRQAAGCAFRAAGAHIPQEIPF